MYKVLFLQLKFTLLYILTDSFTSKLLKEIFTNHENDQIMLTRGNNIPLQILSSNITGHFDSPVWLEIICILHTFSQRYSYS